MERLTERDYNVSDGGAYLKCSEGCAVPWCDGCSNFERLVDRLAAYEDAGLEPEEIREAVDLFDGHTGNMPNEVKKWAERAAWHVRMCDELQEKLRLYEQAEDEGRLLVLPCKVGDTVYTIIDGKIYEGEVYHISYSDYYGKVTTFVVTKSGFAASSGDFGKTTFLTRKEAEEKLKEVIHGE